MKIGKILRTLRKEKKLSLSELSQTTGIQLATLSRMENDKVVGHLKNYVLIAAALNLSVSELFDKLDKGGAFK